MQRVQAERERAQVERDKVQAEMIARLVDRLAPPPPPPQRNLREALGELEDVQKWIDAAAGEGGEEEEETSGPAAPWVLELLKPVIELATLKLNQGTMQVVEQRQAPESPAAASHVSEPATESAEAVNAAPAPSVATSDADIDAKIGKVLALLTPAEAKLVRAKSKQVPSFVLGQAMTKLAGMTPEQAVVELRRLLGVKAPKPSASGPQAVAVGGAR